MKCDLSTFPLPSNYASPLQELNYLKSINLDFETQAIRSWHSGRVKVLEWVIGFEAELRERMVQADKDGDKYGQCVEGGYAWGQWDLAKEILGQKVVDSDDKDA
jgi:hypothetical protein